MLYDHLSNRLRTSVSPKVNLTSSWKNVFHGQYYKHWLAGLPQGVEASQDLPLPTIFAVGGGKGGVGKSVVSSNVSAKISFAIRLRNFLFLAFGRGNV